MTNKPESWDLGQLLGAELGKTIVLATQSVRKKVTQSLPFEQSDDLANLPDDLDTLIVIGGGTLIDEVKALIDSGISGEDLIYYGLEYKFITWYLQSKLSYEEMFSRLEVAIHRFAKRQMTWFRGMERKGIRIHWLDGYMPDEEKAERVLFLLKDEETQGKRLRD